MVDLCRRIVSAGAAVRAKYGVPADESEHGREEEDQDAKDRLALRVMLNQAHIDERRANHAARLAESAERGPPLVAAEPILRRTDEERAALKMAVAEARSALAAAKKARRPAKAAARRRLKKDRAAIIAMIGVAAGDPNMSARGRVAYLYASGDAPQMGPVKDAMAEATLRSDAAFEAADAAVREAERALGRARSALRLAPPPPPPPAAYEDEPAARRAAADHVAHARRVAAEYRVQSMMDAVDARAAALPAATSAWAAASAARLVLRWAGEPIIK